MMESATLCVPWWPTCSDTGVLGMPRCPLVTHLWCPRFHLSPDRLIVCSQVRGQVVRTAARKDTTPKAPLMEAHEVLACVFALRAVALAVLRSGEKTYEAARAIHDAILASFGFGYIPPMRPLVLTSLTRPSYAGEALACLLPVLGLIAFSRLQLEVCVTVQGHAWSLLAQIPQGARGTT